MYAANAAGGKHPHPRHMGQDHGGGHGGGAVLAGSHQPGDVTAAGLGDSLAGLAQVLQLLRLQPYAQLSTQDGAGGGNGAVFPDDGLAGLGGLHILGIWHAVGNDGAFQGHHGLVFRQGGGYFIG